MNEKNQLSSYNIYSCNCGWQVPETADEIEHVCPKCVKRKFVSGRRMLPVQGPAGTPPVYVKVHAPYWKETSATEQLALLQIRALQASTSLPETPRSTDESGNPSKRRGRRRKQPTEAENMALSLRQNGPKISRREILEIVRKDHPKFTMKNLNNLFDREDKREERGQQ